MISNGKELFNLIDLLLSKKGFIKRKTTWYKHFDECITFFVAEKSPYGSKYDHAFGFFLKDLNKTGQEYPVYYKCDSKINLEFLHDPDTVRRLMDLRIQDFNENEREFKLTELFELHVIPFLNEVSTKEGIREAVKKYSDFIYYINWEAREHLGLKAPEEVEEWEQD